MGELMGTLFRMRETDFFSNSSTDTCSLGIICGQSLNATKKTKKKWTDFPTVSSHFFTGCWTGLNKHWLYVSPFLPFFSFVYETGYIPGLINRVLYYYYCYFAIVIIIILIIAITNEIININHVIINHFYLWYTFDK